MTEQFLCLFFFFLIYCEAFWNNPLNVFKPIKWNTASTLCEVYKHERQRHQRTWHASHNKSRCTLHFSCLPWFRASCTGKWHFSVMYLPSNDAIKFMQVDILTWITVVLPADGMLSGSRVICCYDGVYSLATVFFFHFKEEHFWRRTSTAYLSFFRFYATKIARHRAQNTSVQRLKCCVAILLKIWC